MEVEHGHHPHLHGFPHPAIASSRRGLWALTWSFGGLMATASLQVVVVWLSGSVALLADTIHNFADAATAIPLGLAFLLARRAATPRFTYGLGRVEDLAGLLIVVMIAASAILAASQAVRRVMEPEPVQLVWAVAVASLIGFAGNEAVAIFRIRVGRQIGSAALVADGYHARVDGWTSLAVLPAAVGAWLGYPLADPIAGLVISTMIFLLVWQAARTVLLRMLDGVDARTFEEIVHAASDVPSVEDVTDIRARWVGHRLQAEVSITVPATMTVAQGHAVAKEVRHRLLHHIPHLGGVSVHIDPSGEGGERHHRIAAHAHDGLPVHVHD